MAPKSPPSTTLSPDLATRQDLGNPVENFILTFDSGGSDVSDTEALRGSVRELPDCPDNSPSPSPRIADRLQTQKLRRRNRHTALSGGDADLEALDGDRNAREPDMKIGDLAHDTPHSIPELPTDIDVGPMPIWELENKIKEIILKAAPTKEGRKPGQAYIFADPADKAGYFKLGRSETPRKREKAHQGKCNHSTFKLLHTVPRGGPVPWFGRLESLALAELTNMKYSFDCACCTSHKEYFTGKSREGLEILNRWSSWLERSPYDEELQLFPFWGDRLSLLGGATFSHPRCPNAECRSTDIGSSSCQACLSLRLKAWTDVTDFDYFEYECRMRVEPCVAPSSRVLAVAPFWEPSFDSHLPAPTTNLHLLLGLMLWLWLQTNLPTVSILHYGIPCCFAYLRIKKQFADTAGHSQFTKDQRIPRASPKKATRGASNSPSPEMLPEIVSKTETPEEQGPPSKKRSVSVDKCINTPRISPGYGSATAFHEMSEIPKAEHDGPKRFLTPDRATRTVGKSPRAGAKRRKSDLH